MTDVTEFSLFGQKLYLLPILDLYSRDIVSYSISGKPVLAMVTPMPDRAFDKIPNGTELIEYLDCYNNSRAKAKRKDLPPAPHRQQALSAA